MPADRRIVGRCFDGELFTIDGANVWDHEWKRAGDRVTLYDPYFSAEYEHELWEIEVGDRRISFGACETSNNVWAFSVSESSSA